MRSALYGDTGGENTDRDDAAGSVGYRQLIIGARPLTTARSTVSAGFAKSANRRLSGYSKP